VASFGVSSLLIFLSFIILDSHPRDWFHVSDFFFTVYMIFIFPYLMSFLLFRTLWRFIDHLTGNNR
jgi:hypothetical protein